MKFEGTDYSRRTCISITANGSGIGEEWVFSNVKPELITEAKL